MENMASPNMRDLWSRFSEKILSIKKYFHLKNTGKDPFFRPTLSKIRNEIALLHVLLDKMEAELKVQQELKGLLKEVQETAEAMQSEAEHLSEYIPLVVPKPSQSCTLQPPVKHEEQTKVVELQGAKDKPAKEKAFIKEVALITPEEFDSVPAYMKGRLRYDQINAVIQEMNKAVVSKYKIMHQPLKTVNTTTKTLYYRFVEEETKDTKGKFFIVEADIRQFTALRMDKRFYSILNILRHCRRVKEARGLGLVRYIIC